MSRNPRRSAVALLPVALLALFGAAASGACTAEPRVPATPEPSETHALVGPFGATTETLAATAASLSPGAQDPPSDFQAIARRVVDQSPLKWVRRIDANRKAWFERRESEPLDLNPLWASLRIPAGLFDAAESNVECQVTNAELDGRPGAEVVVKLTRSLAFCRYLVFGRSEKVAGGGRNWLFHGYIDHDFNKYEMSSHRIVRAGRDRYLAIFGQTGSGSGFSSYEETWYRVSDDGLSRVLTYESKGGEFPWPCGLGRELRSRVLSTSAPNELPAVRIEFRLTFKTLDYVRDEYRKVGELRRVVRFRRDERSDTFVFDEARSRIGEDEFRSAFGFGEGSPDAARRAILLSWETASPARIARMREFDARCSSTFEAIRAPERSAGGSVSESYKP